MYFRKACKIFILIGLRAPLVHASWIDFSFLSRTRPFAVQNLSQYIARSCCLDSARSVQAASEWKINGNFKDKYLRANGLTNEEIYRVDSSRNLIETLRLQGYKNNKTCIYFKFRGELMTEMAPQLHPALFPKDRVTAKDIFSSQYYDVLKNLYELGAIPDFIIDRILHLQVFGLNDFRMSSLQLLENVKKEFTLPLKEIPPHLLKARIFHQLNKVRNTKKYSEVCYELVQYFQKEKSHSNELILNLCKEIKVDALPYYYYAREKIADITLRKNYMKGERIEEHYRSPLIELLKVSKDEYRPKILNSTISTFLNNGKGGILLPEEICDLKVSAESMFVLLNEIRELKIRNKVFQDLLEANL